MMEWTNGDRAHLLAYKHTPDRSDIRYKEIIKQALLDNKYIIHVMHDEELEKSEAEPDEYFGSCILPFFMIPNTQTRVRNYLCYDIGFKYTSRENHIVRQIDITFYILCNKGDAIDKETGIARHDLIAALIMDEFDWSNYFGFQVNCVSDLASTTDNDYETRTLIFRGDNISHISKTQNNRQKIFNTGVKTLE